jgi:hypothetical protein
VTRPPSVMLHRGEIETRLRQEGYVDYYVELDAQVCAEVDCDCGAPKTRYIGLLKPMEAGDIKTMFRRRAAGTYRAISNCDACGLEVEF